MDARHSEVWAVVPDLMNLGRIREYTGLPVAHYRVFFPRSLPQLVQHLEVLVRDVIALVVFELIVVTHIARRARKVPGHDIPADAAVRQVIECRHPSCERIGMLVRGARGYAEPQVLRNERHCGDQKHRVIHGHLRAVANRGLVASAIHVVGAEDVRNKDAVEGAALQQLRELGPIGEVLVPPGLVIRVAPHPGGLVSDTVHVESIETDLTVRVRNGHSSILGAWVHSARTLRNTA